VTPAPVAPRALRKAKLGAVVVAAVAIAVAYRYGVFAEVADSKSFARALVAMGGWGYVAFVLAYTALQPFGVPGTVFVVAAALIWPWPVAFALSMVGTMAASVVGFSFARFVGRDWVAARMPARFRKHDEALEKRAFRTVVLLRLIFWMSQMLHTFLGVSKVRFWTHFWGSFFGYVVPIFVISYVGPTIFEEVARLPARTWATLGAVLVGALLLAVVVRRRRRAGLGGALGQS
jgi:uncharacterized membrane protein YdjX (TVP38/TMEM64 family)